MSIPGYEGLYEASDLGRIRSIDRISHHPKGALTLKGKILKQYLNNHGYYVVNLTRNGICKTKYVHLLVLSAFLGVRQEGMDGCHNDGNPTNNHSCNLRWDTTKANIADAKKHGTYPHGETHGISKLTSECVRRIRESSLFGATRASLARSYGVSPSTISEIVMRKRWIHI